ncbi:MAG: hypothetical protein ISQ63_00410 [SAR86 cluster bacterium]|uniref:MORN repeat protein n=1 Tax=SAR86 cluster bacterium TaxID=2030880 RepID=A0A937LG87_9GAMM|nr:hypothetical protein [SAR86 cluster bacterium]
MKNLLILILALFVGNSFANAEWLESELKTSGMTIENFTSIFPSEEIENFSSLFSPKIDKTKTLMFFYFGVKDGQQLEDAAIRLSETFPSIMDINEDVLLDFLIFESEGKKLGLSGKEFLEIHESFVQLTWENGNKYNGQVKNENIPHGKGTFTWPTGTKYIGDFKEGILDGKGTYYWPDNRIYIGDFKEGKSDGKGTMTWPNGDEYVGDFKEDKRTGKGTFTWSDGSNYVGDFVDGWRTGKGTHTYSNGDIYVGEQKNSKRHGFGKYTWADGSFSEGIWENGASPEKVEARNKKQFVPYAVCLGGNKEPQIKTLINLFSSNNNPAAVSYMLDVGCNNSWRTPIPGKDLEEFTRNRNFVGVKSKEYMSGIGWIYAMIQVDDWDSY